MAQETRPAGESDHTTTAIMVEFILAQFRRISRMLATGMKLHRPLSSLRLRTAYPPPCGLRTFVSDT